MLRPAIAALFLIATPAGAEPLGIDFGALPAGTALYYSNSFQGRMVDIYVGFDGQAHHVERRAGSPYGEKLSDHFFNALGLEVRRVDADGAVSDFAPFNCERFLGTCTHTLTTARGPSEVAVETTQSGGSYQSTITFLANGFERRRRFELVNHGLYAFVRENDTQIALDDIVRP
ncbi:MAG: hypothetical protein AAFO93_13535 [Pseudomonadota bacterium]